ncbi:hypothetical protein [Vibrio sinus]|uniref:hypothetical protein n=1 Tax=Vibrio sinus TaxID=2946865 RepID=UPI003D7C49E2
MNTESYLTICELTVLNLSVQLVTQFIETILLPKKLVIIINECPHRLIGLYC